MEHLTIPQMREHADRIVPIIEKMVQPSFDMRDPPTERNRNIAISVLRGQTLVGHGVSRSRAAQITHRLYRRAEALSNDKFGYPTSARLVNCIKNMLDVPYDFRRVDLTKKQFLEIAAMTDAEILRTPNFGKRTLEELRTIERVIIAEARARQMNSELPQAQHDMLKLKGMI